MVLSYDRVVAKDGTDVTSLSYMKLRKFLGEKGVDKQKLFNAAGVHGLRVLGVDEGLLDGFVDDEPAEEARWDYCHRTALSRCHPYTHCYLLQ